MRVLPRLALVASLVASASLAIDPPARSAEPRPVAPAAAVAAAPAAGLLTPAQVAASTPGEITGYGFDQCVAPTQRAMDAWLASSPYRAVGIYISGDSRACRTQPNLSPTWISTQVAQGWRLLPIALGPQASCQPRFPRYDDDVKISARRDADGGYSTAVAQGVAEAEKNAADAAAYGIGAGATLWYDLEGFDYTNLACRESALWFVHGWTTRIQQLGYVSGMYSSASSGIKMLDDARVQRPGQVALPQRIWIARWDGQPNTSTTYISEEGWRPGGRMKQYRGGHEETWGGVTINIDSNYLELGTLGTPPPPVVTPPPAGPAEHCGGVKVSFGKYYTLRPGKAAPSRTRALQCLLQERGRYDGPLHGKYNRTTRVAAKAWMRQAGLQQTGTFSRRHWVALLAGTERPKLAAGANGEVVASLQRALTAAGHPVTVNGAFDEPTVAALTAYQRAVKARASGRTNASTWRKLAAGRV